MRTRRPCSVHARSAFAGFRFPSDVIVLAVRWYLRFGLSYRDVEELRSERGVEVDHVTVYRWVLRFTPLLADAARPCRHGVGDRWQVDETSVKVAGHWRDLYRAIDQFGQVIDVFVAAAETPRPPVGASTRPSARPRSRPRGHHRSGAGLFGRVGGSAASGMAPHRPVRQQPGRGGSRQAEGAAAADARAQARPQRKGGRGWACIHAEPSPWPLRAGGRGANEPASGRFSRRTGRGDLIPRAGLRLQPALRRGNATAPVRPIWYLWALAPLVVAVATAAVLSVGPSGFPKLAAWAQMQGFPSAGLWGTWVLIL